MLSVCMCARFQATPKESHHKVVKHILRYLAHTPTLGLWYPKGSAFDLILYSDSDYVVDRVDRKSTSGTCHFLGRSLVCWSPKKQNCVSLSTAEAEYIVAGSCCAQLLWMKQTLKDYGINVKNVPLYCDNKSDQDCSQSSSALEDKAHPDSSASSSRSCVEGRHLHRPREG